MARRRKASPKPKSRKSDDTDQSARFIEVARALGVDESGKTFEAAFSKLVPPKRRRRRSAT